MFLAFYCAEPVVQVFHCNEQNIWAPGFVVGASGLTEARTKTEQEEEDKESPVCF